MTLPVPPLDDRSFLDLVREAQQRITATDPDWTDLSVHDPGMVLVDAFAHLTDVMLYRLNRVPDRLYAVFLNLLGTQLWPPVAAGVELVVSRATAEEPVTLPAGTRVGPAQTGGGGPVFATSAAVVLERGELSATVEAVDAELHQGVEVGVGTGTGGQWLRLPAAPVVQGAALRVGVEAAPGAVAAGTGLVVDGLPYRDWREVTSFADVAPGDEVFVADRSAGLLTFAPALAGGPGEEIAPVAAVPAQGRRIRAWWSSGGGARGNVAAGALTVFRDPAPGLLVTNPLPARGGRDTESVEHALRRAPQQFHARDRAVTARDYELLAEAHSGAVAVARALNRRSVWSFAQPGQVAVVLVPWVPEQARPEGRVGPETLDEYAVESVRRQIAEDLQQRAPLGATVIVDWASYKTVAVRARVVVRPEEDAQAVRARILRRLYDTITPLPSRAGAARSGSSFGRALRVSNLYRALEQSEPGVQYVQDVRFRLGDVPDADVGPLERDAHQRDTFFAGCGPILFRTSNRGEGWEPCGRFPDERVHALASHPAPVPERPQTIARPGWIAVTTRTAQGSRVYVSESLGESGEPGVPPWRLVASLGWAVSDLAWVERAGGPTLLLAGTAGLYEVAPTAGATPVRAEVVPVQPGETALGFYAVDSFTDYRGRTGVVVAAEASGGVWLSPQAGATGTFATAGRDGEDIRTLAVQYDGPVTYVWAGRAVRSDAESGCARLRIDDLGNGTTGASDWATLSTGWTGGSCWGIAFGGSKAYAATQSGGLLSVDLTRPGAAWAAPGINSGLPRRDDPPRLEPVTGVAAVPDGSLVLTAGPKGVHRSGQDDRSFVPAADREPRDGVTLPPTWMFCSGEHEVEVVTGHAT